MILLNCGNSYFNFLIPNLSEFPITIMSEKAIDMAPNIGCIKPAAAKGIHNTL
jgi:hypothetical protein